jgi:hypothetical protein
MEEKFEILTKEIRSINNELKRLKSDESNIVPEEFILVSIS